MWFFLKTWFQSLEFLFHVSFSFFTSSVLSEARSVSINGQLSFFLCGLVWDVSLIRSFARSCHHDIHCHGASDGASQAVGGNLKKPHSKNLSKAALIIPVPLSALISLAVDRTRWSQPPFLSISARVSNSSWLINSDHFALKSEPWRGVWKPRALKWVPYRRTRLVNLEKNDVWASWRVSVRLRAAVVLRSF